MTRLVAYLNALDGWRKRSALVLLGALAALALPPFHVLPVLALSFPALLLLLIRAPRRWAAFATGWWFGFGYFVAGLYWISNALLLDPWRFGWFIPFSLFGLSGLLAVFTGLATFLAWFTARTGLRAALALAASWALLEWVRGLIMTGFPWNPIASVWVPVGPVLQALAWMGPFGLGFLTVLAACSLALLWTDVPQRRLKALAPLVPLVLLALAGAWRLGGAETQMTDGVRLRLVQPNTSQALKWKTDLRFQHLLRQIEMSLSPTGPAPTHVIWAETAVPYIIDHDVQARLALAKAAPPGGLVITGAVRTSAPGVEPYQVWNSMEAVDESGRIRGVFDKFHLVPFGEYVPLKHLLPLPKITAGSTDFSPGPGPRTVELPGLPPVGPLICYEVIFPHAVTDPANRPAWLLNLTNDGWYGFSTGPFQHFAQARMRAVEEGLPLVRVANTGISGVVDPWGRVTARLGLGETGILDADLPKPLNSRTLYTDIGDGPVVLVLLLLSIGLKFMICHKYFSRLRYPGSG
ncbi:MAG: apolipoprotein N-acyltransferase [Rhodospirillales bacterium]|nr:MAG: apolipoprotein N-acyltransferase [Rhodospirillales bacterium]